MPHVSIRLDQELYDKIESIRGYKDRSAYIKEILVTHLNAESNTSGTQSNTEVAHLENEVEYLKKMLDLSSQEKNNLMKLLHQEQALHLQTQKQIMPSPEEIAKKSWWQFWKK